MTEVIDYASLNNANTIVSVNEILTKCCPSRPLQTGAKKTDSAIKGLISLQEIVGNAKRHCRTSSSEWL